MVSWIFPMIRFIPNDKPKAYGIQPSRGRGKKLEGQTGALNFIVAPKKKNLGKKH